MPMAQRHLHSNFNTALLQGKIHSLLKYDVTVIMSFSRLPILAIHSGAKIMSIFFLSTTCIYIPLPNIFKEMLIGSPLTSFEKTWNLNFM